MAAISSHGGYCCGRRHMFCMNGAAAESIRADMNREGLLGDADTINKITEIVVSEENDELHDLRDEIVNAGFVLVARWLNNSGSMCYMYLHANDWVAFPNGAEARIQQVAIPAAPAPVRIVARRYHNVLRDGRSEAGWPTLAQAREAAPRARSVDCCHIYSDGTVEWVGGV